MSDQAFDTDTIVKDGRTYRVEYFADYGRGAPWTDDDGRGIVSEWTLREPTKGERVLSVEDHGRQKRYYDFAATVKIAKRDGWGVEGGKRKGETPTQYATRAVEEDYAFLRAWCRDEWLYCGVVATLIDADGLATKYSESLWGVETWKDYHRTIPAELIEEIEARIAAAPPTAADTLGAIAALMSGREWNTDTLDGIAKLVRAAGLTITEPTPEPSGARHTSCRYCEQDIEGIAPYRRGEWRDRGGNTTCPTPEGDAGLSHAPYIEGGKDVRSASVKERAGR